MQPRLESIRQVRKRLGITQKSLARMCDISASMINQIESGRSKPSYDTAKKIFDNLASLEGKTTSQTAGSLCSEDIVKLYEQDTLQDAIKKMRQYSISQIPVFHGKDPVGAITEDGIVKFLASEESDLKSIKLASAMEPIPPIVDHDTPAALLVPLIRYSKCILVSKKSKIVGIITASDALKIMG
ncbi:MAG: helix-turn-helix domain-containing protein [Cenarchaeum sp. SB0665_bin_23]|nr:helix-turn-helix domain-containing protein [Cenarchaeum sp. SB0665_bin_23]